jgi:hypothetical protein
MEDRYICSYSCGGQVRGLVETWKADGIWLTYHTNVSSLSPSIILQPHLRSAKGGPGGKPEFVADEIILSELDQTKW